MRNIQSKPILRNVIQKFHYIRTNESVFKILNFCFSSTYRRAGYFSTKVIAEGLISRRIGEPSTIFIYEKFSGWYSVYREGLNYARDPRGLRQKVAVTTVQR